MIKKITLIILGMLTLALAGCIRRENKTYIYGPPKVSNTKVTYFSKYGYPSLDINRVDKTPYLQYESHLLNGKGLAQTEKNFIEFYRDLKVRGYGDNSSHWRWFFKISEDTYSKSINKSLYDVYRSSPSYIFTLENNKWVKKSLKPYPLGELKNLIVLERGKSGIITQLLVRGTRGEYLIKGEYSIRMVMGLDKDNTGTDIIVRMAKGGSNTYENSRKNTAMLPSGYFAIEHKRGYYYIYGGGFGHGAGMSQFGAYDLTTNYNKSYKDVLNFYYKNVELKDMYKMKGVNKNIRVGITDNNLTGLDHSVVSFVTTASGKISGGVNLSLRKGSSVKIVPVKSRGMDIYVNGAKQGSTKKMIKVSTTNNRIQVTSLKRKHVKVKSPIYRGVLEIKPSPSNSSRLRLINDVYIEDYLLQVVPSEMPQYFGVEALKAQAVAARTYALSDFKKGIFKSEGFHVKDNTMSQVYNNIDENTVTTEAVKATKGLVLLYNGQPIDAKYYSTSSGFGASATTVWQ